MKVETKKYELKYQAQDELLDFKFLNNLDSRTLHEVVKAMLLNTVNDCIKYENEMDKEMSNISFLMNEKISRKSKIKDSQYNLKNAIYFSTIAEDSLKKLLEEMLFCDEIKLAFKQDIPELFEGLYCLIEIEYDIVDELVTELSESYELNYQQICSAINNCIIDLVDNAEEYLEDIKECELYEDFVEYREEWRKKKGNM